MAELNNLLQKLEIDAINKLKRPVHRNKEFEIRELSATYKQSKKDRITLMEAWFGNIPITVWDKDILEYKSILPTRLNYSSDKVTLPFNYKKYKYKIEPLLEYPQFRYNANNKTFVGFSDYDSFIILYSEDRPLFTGTTMINSYANIYSPVWQECSLELIQELSEKESIRNTLRKAGYLMKVDIETRMSEIYEERRKG